MAIKKLKQCPKGHSFYKSSDCPVCPVCASEDNKAEGFLSILGAPAKRALQNSNISTLNKLSSHTEKEILQLHGMGKASIPVLRKALTDAGLKFNS